MKIGLYAGSFDPWSVGHQYVLQKAFSLFDTIHIVVAVHPSKQSRLDAETRARLVAHAVDSLTNWWNVQNPFRIHIPASKQAEKVKMIVVNTHDGLVADYAKEHDINHLIRGLRSTTDFEAEFNLYFANHAINDSLQTWAIMCPPKLLHCSSTYIRAVVGKPNIQFVGTSFAAQAIMLNKPTIVGQLFDLFLLVNSKILPKIELEKFHVALQLQFSGEMQKETSFSNTEIEKITKQVFTSSKKLAPARVYADLLRKMNLSI